MNVFGYNDIDLNMRISDRLKLRHLEVFVEVARKKSVTKAASTLNLTQPAVSRTLRELEEVCGKTLVEKDGRGIRLTPHGQVFFDFAGHSLAQARDGLDAMRNFDTDTGPPLTIGALPTVSATIVPEATARFRAAGLRAQLTIKTGENDVLLDQLRRGVLDLVVGRLPEPENMRGLTFDPLYREPVIAVVAADHALTRETGLTTQKLEAFPVLVPNRGSIIRQIVERLFIELGLTPPRDAIETVSDSFGRAFVKNHNAVWFISRGAVAAELDDGSFAALGIDTSSTLGPVGLCLRRGHTLLPTGVMFCDQMRAVIAERAS